MTDQTLPPYDYTVGWHDDRQGYSCPSCDYTVREEGTLSPMQWQDLVQSVSAHRLGHYVARLGTEAEFSNRPTCPECGQDCGQNLTADDDDYDTIVGQEYDDLPALEGVAALLKSDLERARKFWYPVNADGSFNR